jgi:predicted RNA-binding Zn-ribbon protein involved in translation (DUF1610 family)
MSKQKYSAGYKKNTPTVQTNKCTNCQTPLTIKVKDYCIVYTCSYCGKKTISELEND